MLTPRAGSLHDLAIQASVGAREAVIGNAAQDTRSRSGARSFAAILLAVLGCLAIGASLLNAYQLAGQLAPAYGDWVTAVLFFAGVTGIGILVGIALLMSAHACRPSARPSTLKLWGKLLILLGLVLSVCVPVMAYGTLLFRALNGGADQFSGYEYPNVYDASLALLAVQMTVVPIALGLAAIVAAVIWGRRKRPPDVLSVFN